MVLVAYFHYNSYSYYKMNRVNVLMLFGGESSEHEVSIASARNVYDAIDTEKYKTYLVFIDKTGRWYVVDSFEDIDDNTKMSPVAPVFGSNHFSIIGKGDTINPDVIFPILHGINGEDGSVQAVAQLLHTPVVGCDMTSSAICMDKVFSKQLLEQNGIKTVPYVVHMSGEDLFDFDDLVSKLGNKLFVKPANGGSSVGVSKVENKEDFEDAVKKAHVFDDKVLIERALEARELEVSVLGSGSEIKASGAGEIIPDRDFYDYDSKYDPKSKTLADIPAKLSEEVSKNIAPIAIKVYKTLGCSGLARVDFFLTKEDELFVNEINTIPGFTDISMYPKLWQQEGLSYRELIDELIRDALAKAKI